ERERLQSGEFYALLMWGTVGMMMMAKGLDLLVVILGLELLSICIFILVGFHRRIAVSNEASLKYFLMGAFATGFVLYGTALFYGATQSTNFAVMSRWFAGARPSDLDNPLLTIGSDSVAAIAVYAVVYALMNIGAFGVVSMLAKNQNDPQTLDDIAGLGFKRPFVAVALMVCMFSLSGLPPTAGFIAKFYIF